MSKKMQRSAFIFCAVLFAVALLISLLFAAPGEEGTVLLSEVVASNRTSPAPDGQYLDYIELHNTGTSPVDISGYMLSDKPDAIGYTFPQGTVLPAGGYIVCWCNKNADSPLYGKFGISNDGTDSVYLYNDANVIIDRADIPVVGTNVAYTRTQDGTWQRFNRLTPGFANSEEGYAAWLRSNDTQPLQVVISEILPGAACLAADGSERITDWVELYNPASEPADLTGAYLTDDLYDPVKWQLPELILQPGEYCLIRCAGDEAAPGDADFLLSRDGGTVLLSGKLGQTLCRVDYPSLGKDVSWAAQDGAYALHRAPTPGYENSENGYKAWLQAVNADSTSVVISEIMSANRSTLLSAGGQLCDWVELYNPSSEPADLTGFYLSADPDDRGKWQIPQLTLMPGERKVILCAGNHAAEGEATFSISRDGATVTLTGKAGNLLHSVEMPPMEQDRVWALQENGSYAADLPTPGYENSESGREAYLQQTAPLGGLIISEVMPSNSVYYRQLDGKCYDWVELYNADHAPIELSDYCLTDDPDRPELFRLPQQQLQPGEYLIVICSGSAELSGEHIYAPFTLSRQDGFLYLVGPDGYSDYLHIYDVPDGGSVGRQDGRGTFYFTRPTPAKANGNGVLLISSTPTAATAAGVYNDVATLQVTLSGQDLRYTTDGSTPTKRSKAYTGPISLNQTTVVRFASFQDGRIPSDVVTAPYIINENHTLPVVSMATAPANLFSPSGLYENYESEEEVPCNITLFDENGGFSVDCGLKMYGHMGLTLPKKSFKINFRGRYGTDLLTYPVFGADGPQAYDSLVIRSGQDYTNTIFRDELFTSLCREVSDQVLAQRDKHCILYINGEYWGIYTIKEAFGETMYAENYGVSPDSVTVQQAPVGTDAEIFSLLGFCRQNDLSDPENYAYFASRIDIDSFIDWIIFEGYSSNTDISQNLRYFKSAEMEDKWQFALYDLDWAWYFRDGFYGLLAPDKVAQHATLGLAAFQNKEFRAKFLTRMAQLKNGVLSNEHVLQRIDHYVQLLSPEVEREKARWGGNYAQWEKNVEKMRSYITENDHWARLERQLTAYVGLTDTEKSTYLGG